MTGDVPYIQQGWKCPQCGKINAPFVRSCNCSHYMGEPCQPYDPWGWEKWKYPWYPYPWLEPYPKITWQGSWTTTSGTTYVTDDGSTTIQYGP